MNKINNQNKNQFKSQLKSQLNFIEYIKDKIEDKVKDIKIRRRGLELTICDDREVTANMIQKVAVCLRDDIEFRKEMNVVIDFNERGMILERILKYMKEGEEKVIIYFNHKFLNRVGINFLYCLRHKVGLLDGAVLLNLINVEGGVSYLYRDEKSGDKYELTDICMGLIFEEREKNLKKKNERNERINRKVGRLISMVKIMRDEKEKKRINEIMNDVLYDLLILKENKNINE